MNKDEIMQKLQDIFRDIFCNDELIISKTTDASEIAEWDSLTHINLFAAIQADFSITFSIDEIMSIKNVSDIVNSVAAKLAN